MKGLRGHYSKLLIPLFTALAFSCRVLAAPVELSLDDSIALALKHNPEIKIAQSDRDKALWAVKQAGAGKGFSLSLTHISARYSSPPSAYGYLSKNIFDNELELSLPVYSGGKLESQINQAKLNLKVADLNIAATKQQLVQSVTTYYFNVLQYRNELRVNQDTAENYAAHLKNVQAQYNAGTVAKSDVLSSEVSLANAQINLIKAQNNYELAVASLNNAMGLPLDTKLTLTEELRYEKYSPGLEECVKLAVANRPEMAEYQTKIAIAGEDVKIARSGYLPTVSLVADQNWYNKDFPGSKNSNWQVCLLASISIFDSGLTKAKVSQAQASLTAALEQARQKHDSIVLEVRQYYLNMREAEKRIETNKVAVHQAEENLRIAEVRYSAGAGTNLDVLDAVLALNQAKTNDIQALYDYNTSKAQLVKAMGVAVKDKRG